ncbi:hypothetical protein NECAME_18606, partial [Necator americanus]
LFGDYEKRKIETFEALDKSYTAEQNLRRLNDDPHHLVEREYFMFQPNLNMNKCSSSSLMLFFGHATLEKFMRCIRLAYDTHWMYKHPMPVHVLEV